MIKARVNRPVITVNNDKLKVVKGETGAVFTPYVDELSNISWSNNGGLTNPPTRNIKGSDASITAITNLELEAILEV